MIELSLEQQVHLESHRRIVAQMSRDQLVELCQLLLEANAVQKATIQWLVRTHLEGNCI